MKIHKMLGLALSVILLHYTLAPGLWAQDSATPAEEERYGLLESQASGLEGFDGGFVEAFLGLALFDTGTLLAITGIGVLLYFVGKAIFSSGGDDEIPTDDTQPNQEEEEETPQPEQE
jgi:hypothetical protein